MTMRVAGIAGAVLVLTQLLGAVAQEPTSVEERLKKLEQELDSLQRENRELRKELGLEPKGPVPWLKPAGQAAEVKFGGYIQAQAEFGDPGDARWTGKNENDRFYVRRARLASFGTFLEHFSYRLEMDLAGALGESSNLRAQLTDGWANWHQFDFANLKIGQFFPTFGWEKRLAPTKLLAVEYSLAGDRLLPDRQLGAEVSGHFLGNRLGYYAGFFNGNNLNNNFNDNEDFLVAPRLEGVPVLGKWGGKEVTWSVGLSGYYSDDASVSLPTEIRPPGTTTYAGLRTALGADTQFRWGPVDIWAEYFWTDMEPVGSPDYTAEGWYVLGGYYIVPKLQAIVKFESFDPKDTLADNATEAWTFGVNYYLKGDSLKLMLDYVLFDCEDTRGTQQKFLGRLQAAF
jgi:phosphate-selective porin